MQDLDRLRSFTYMTSLQVNTKEQIYRLLYPNTVRYLGFDPLEKQWQLLNASGNIIEVDIEPLQKKVHAYERLAGNALDRENMSAFLRIDETKYLLNELIITNKSLEQQLYHRLSKHMDYQISRRYCSPLLLPNLLEHNEFVFNYLQTNIGQPDKTDNYFNKLREMIQQITEQTDTIRVPSYFRVLQTILKYLHQFHHDPVRIITGRQSYAIMVSGSDLLPAKYHNLIHTSIPTNQNMKIISLENNVITDMIKIYNSL